MPNILALEPTLHPIPGDMYLTFAVPVAFYCATFLFGIALADTCSNPRIRKEWYASFTIIYLQHFAKSVLGEL